MVSRAEIRAHRADVSTLTTLAKGDLAAAFRNFGDGVEAREVLREILPRLVALYGSAAATLGADWYDEMREAQEIPGTFRAIPAELPDKGRTDALARWGVAPLFGKGYDLSASLALVSGGLQRTIADMSRRTVTRSAVSDYGSVGWQRMGAGSCSFCQLLIGRGAVYSEETADFGSHDDCNCQAVPIFKGAEPIDVRDYVKSTRNISDADRARVRDYIASNNL